ncbi:glutathione peroxidase [bacterium]|nr:glutathione peroxidase [bacterium]
MKGFHEITVDTISGRPLSLSEFRGKVVLVVNVASRCGYTPQYSGLQKLYDTYKNNGFVVLGVPSNDFFQERGNETEIKNFCQTNFNITFPMTAKMQVRKAPVSALYRYLTQSVPGGPVSVSWNFNKFLVDQNGNVVAYFGSNVAPTDSEIVGRIEHLLKIPK